MPTSLPCKDSRIPSRAEIQRGQVFVQIDSLSNITTSIVICLARNILDTGRYNALLYHDQHPRQQSLVLTFTPQGQHRRASLNLRGELGHRTCGSDTAWPL